MTNAADTRELVLGILLEITERGAYSHTVLFDTLEKYQYLARSERAFITRVTEGTLENLIQIDYIISQFSKVPVEKLRPVIRCILQSAVYQICYMDAAPDFAVCSEAVKLAKKKGFRSLSGFVNAVLRTVIRQRGQIVWPQRETEPEQYLSVRYSIPVWMIQMWKEESAYDWTRMEDLQKMEDMLAAFHMPAPVTIRTNTDLCTPQELKRQLEAEGVTVTEIEALPYAFQITGYDRIHALRSFQDGLFYVQDISSMLAVEAAAPQEGDFVLDACAAPGGKAVHMAQLLHGTGHVLARDVTEAKVELLRQNISRCRTANIKVQIWDAKVFDASLLGRADIVLADVPCSGLGVMRRKKDIRQKMDLSKAQELVQVQREILSVVQHYVRPQGRLVYCTCTIHRAENEGNAQWFIDAYPQFALKSSRQLLPGADCGDGFYIAIFEKTNEKINAKKQEAEEL